MSHPLRDVPALFHLLEQWVTHRWLRDIDLALARFFHAEVPDAPAPLLLASALVSHQLGRGHVCLDLALTLGQPEETLALPPSRMAASAEPPVLEPADLLTDLSLTAWRETLQHPALVSAGPGRTPLVLTGHRLYLRRYWQAERSVEAAIRQRLALGDTLAATLPPAQVQAGLNELFPPSSTFMPDWQKIACAVAVRSAFSVITGGPGTGKTTTVVRLLALLQRLALAQDPHRPLVIRLAAPTGKAAARLKQSIGHALHQLPDANPADALVRQHIPSEVSTLHRLLGSRPDSRLFRHDARHPLALDVLVIDEASMVDLDMMAATLQALPPAARLVLLGDKDQLASVEAGSVLGELCQRAAAGHYTPAQVTWMQAMTGQLIPAELQDPQGTALDQHLVMLRHSHRFDQHSGIGQLANAVNAGDTAAIQRVWSEGYADIRAHHLPTVDDDRLDAVVLGPMVDDGGPQGLARYLQHLHQQRPALEAERTEWDRWALDVLAAHGRFQLLCALRHGPAGVSGLNARIEAILKKHHLIDLAGPWYAGRPVIITRNDYTLGLMNGDIGITLPCPVDQAGSGQRDWGLRVAFPTHEANAPVRWVLPSRLHAVETVYALTVHKSQGSEFEHCALLLPPEPQPVLTRELIYTGITRGKAWFSVIHLGHPRLLEEAATHTVQRSGGLFDTANPD
jgi:exodeoxyribonuclease V alpha subunit